MNNDLQAKLSCDYIEKHLFIDNDALYLCPPGFGRNASPWVKFNGDYHVAVDDFLEMRKKTLYDLNEGIECACTNCRCLKVEPWQMEDIEKITTVHYGNGGICNFSCCYCVVSAKNNKANKELLRFNEIVTALKARGSLNKEANAFLSAGEITINPNRDEIFALLEDFSFCLFFTNAYRYDKSIANILKANRGIILVSFDAGTRETFKKIKGIDAFNQVCDSLHKYAMESAEAIHLKYILLPGINDNEPEIDNFFELVKELRIKHVIVSADLFDPQLNENIISIATYFYNKAMANSVLCETNSDILSREIGIMNRH